MKTVFITGASRGIGKACAELFAQNGYRVAATYLKSEKEAEELEKNYENIHFFKLNLADRKNIFDVVADVKSQFGKIDLLINNAGIAQTKLFSDITESDLTDMIDINLKGAFYACQAVLDGMIAEKSGKIINISSIWGITGASCEVHYSMVKSGLIALTRALAKEVALSGITVNAIAPGVVETDMMKGFSEAERADILEGIPLGRFASPCEIAKTALFLAEESGDYITGQIISPNGGLVI